MAGTEISTPGWDPPPRGSTGSSSCWFRRRPPGQQRHERRRACERSYVYLQQSGLQGPTNPVQFRVSAVQTFGFSGTSPAAGEPDGRRGRKTTPGVATERSRPPGVGRSGRENSRDYQLANAGAAARHPQLLDDHARHRRCRGPHGPSDHRRIHSADRVGVPQ